MKVQARITISGQVQGVGYRAATCAEARRLGLDGWVRNLANGGVEALAAGERARVEELIHWCRSGPARATVDAVSVEWPEAQMPESGFMIRYGR